MRNEAVLANELAAVSTETLHLSLPTLVTLCFLRVSHLLQDLSHLKKVLDVEGRGQTGHAHFGERGGFAAVGAQGAQFVSLCPHQFLQTTSVIRKKSSFRRARARAADREVWPRRRRAGGGAAARHMASRTRAHERAAASCSARRRRRPEAKCAHS